MIYVEAPEDYIHGGVETAVFLAGGITDCPDWQSEMVELLSDTDLVLFNPRRKGFDVRDPNASDVQIRWENKHLKAANRILFWFPHSPPSVCPITLWELGYWTRTQKRLAIGIEPGYVREYDVRMQTGLERPDVPIVSTLEDLAETIK